MNFLSDLPLTVYAAKAQCNWPAQPVYQDALVLEFAHGPPALVGTAAPLSDSRSACGRVTRGCANWLPYRDALALELAHGSPTLVDTTAPLLCICLASDRDPPVWPLFNDSGSSFASGAIH